MDIKIYSTRKLIGIALVLLGSHAHAVHAASITRQNISTAGVQANAGSASVTVSANGRYVAFSSAATNLVDNDSNGRDDIFLRDRVSGSGP